jgi:hypothetical protein
LSKSQHLAERPGRAARTLTADWSRSTSPTRSLKARSVATSAASFGSPPMSSRTPGAGSWSSSTVERGQRVGFSVGGRRLAAVVIEDRGDLGARGQRVRLAVEDAFNPTTAFGAEAPVDWVEPVPPG